MNPSAPSRPLEKPPGACCPWRPRLAIAVQLLVGLFTLLAISDKWREGADGAAVAAALCALVLAVFFLQEKARAESLLPGFGFLRERGIPERRIAVSRAAGAAVAAGLLALAALGAAAATLFLLERLFLLTARVMGPVEEILTPEGLVPVGTFVVAAALLAGGASLLGGRAARSARK